MKIYTKTGDDGLTGLLASGRVPKDGPRIEAYGTVDELNAMLGVARSLEPEPIADALLDRLQSELFVLGSALADPNPGGPFHGAITTEHVGRLEQDIDAMQEQLPPLTCFILPGGKPVSAQIQLARTVCRRAERRVVSLRDTPGEHVPERIVIYLNRLSDLLFVLARWVNHRAGVADIPWRGV